MAPQALEDDNGTQIGLYDESLESRLGKIRVHVTSKLAHQSHLALILAAVEENFEEQKTERTAAAYFVSFLSLLDEAISNDEIVNKELANSSVYLLDIVCAYTSSNLLRSKFGQIFKKLALALGHPDADAALLRSSLGALESVLLAQNTASWQQPTTQLSPRRAMVGILSLGLDPRPKVRKRAQEVVSKVLSNPPPSPKIEHPVAELCAEISLKAVVSAFENSNKGQTDAKAIHTLQLVKAITGANGWPMDNLEVLCEALLDISRTSDQYLVVAAFDVFEAVFRSIKDEVNAPKLEKLMDAIFDLTPSPQDHHLAPAWLTVVAEGGESFCQLLPAKCFARLPAMIESVVKFLESENENVRISASQCFVALVTTAIPEEYLVETNSSKKAQLTDSILTKICNLAFGLLHVRFQGSWKEVMEVLVALFEKLRWRSDPYMVNALKVVGALRSEESFAEGRDGADSVIGAAIRYLGPEMVLDLFPLNLQPVKGQPSRAWLLPLLRDNVYCANLAHFVDYFVPLSQTLEAKVEQMRSEGASGQSAMHLKIYQTMNEQIWSLLPRYCDLPMDLTTAFSQQFAQLLAARLYEKVDERASICQSLRLLVESNVAYAEGAVDDDAVLQQKFPKAEAAKNVEYLSSQFGQNVLKALFNVFVSTSADHRGFILESITSYLVILSEDDLITTFNNVSKLLGAEIEKPEGAESTMASVLADLIVAIAPHVPKSSHNSLLAIFIRLVRMDNAPQLQKKAYRILTRMAESNEGEATVKENIGNLEALIAESTKGVATPARGARLAAISKLLPLLPQADLHFIATILPETVLCTKDVNEKTREAAFELLVDMGNKMAAGGQVDQSRIEGMGNDADAIGASLEEYFTMVSAGLAGDSAHMISATVTALSRIIFEFREQIPMELLMTISSTVELFLEHSNREIVKSTLGFVKITAVSLPVEIVEPQLKSLLAHLMVWSHEHKGHFRAKVKHIIERLLRRFGYDKISENFPEEDRKLLSNIRKSKERAKRNKAAEIEAGGAGGSTADAKQGGRKYANEFDEAIYGSSSDDSGDEEMEEDQWPKGRRGNQNQKYIMEEDSPIDFLDKASLAHISSSKPRDQSNPTLKKKFDKDASGKILVQEDVEMDDDVTLESGIDAYVAAMKSGPVRGQRNKLKYKRSREDSDGEDDEDDKAPKSRGNERINSGRISKDTRGGRQGHRGGRGGGRGGRGSSRGGNRGGRGGGRGGPSRSRPNRRF